MSAGIGGEQGGYQEGTYSNPNPVKLNRKGAVRKNQEIMVAAARNEARLEALATMEHNAVVNRDIATLRHLELVRKSEAGYSAHEAITAIQIHAGQTHAQTLTGEPLGPPTHALSGPAMTR